jgi:ABC-type molybdenum transport system ATPase subunit/photorepair protein PhrA
MNFFLLGLVFLCAGIVFAILTFVLVRLYLRKKLLMVKEKCEPLFFDETAPREVREIVLKEDPFLFFASVFENIKYGKIAASDEEVAAAAERAGIAHILTEKSCEHLTKGERRLVAAARAVLKNPRKVTVGRGLSEVDLLTVKNLNLL